jgi:hypothetical protein
MIEWEEDGQEAVAHLGLLRLRVAPQSTEPTSMLTWQEYRVTAEIDDDAGDTIILAQHNNIATPDGARREAIELVRYLLQPQEGATHVVVVRTTFTCQKCRPAGFTNYFTHHPELCYIGDCEEHGRAWHWPTHSVQVEQRGTTT